MKAIIFDKYGSPDVLRLEEVQKPTPTENQVLVKIHAASANPLDWHRMRAEPFLARLDGGFFKPKDITIGADFAGVVEAVGANVHSFQPGDAVYGERFTGSFAEYICVTEKTLARKPDNISFEEAAATPVAAFTALQGLRDAGHIQAGQKVLVNGAAGGVGTFGVQIAKAFGAEVTGVCSTRNLELVRSIGAAYAIDYTIEDFTNTGKKYDLIFDAIGNRSVRDLERALTPNGNCAVAGFTSMARLFETILLGRWVSRKGSKKIGLMGMAQSNQQDLLIISELMQSGKVKPVIDRCYPLEQTAEAIRYLEKGHARGKVIVTVV